jgi:DNA-binding transcriptional ArsR family regulator
VRDGIDLTVQQGSILALLDPNGAGMTTAIHLLTTYLRPDAGEIRISGRDPAKNPQAVRRAIGVTGQFSAVDGYLTGRWYRAYRDRSRGSPAVPDSRERSIHKMKSIIHFVERQPAPSLLPILRSQQQGEILALLLGDPALELSLTEIAVRAGAPPSSVHREIERAERAGLVTTRKVGNTRLARANTDSPYYAGLSEVLTRAFGVPAIVAQALAPVAGISAAYIYGSWAARHQGHTGQRPVGDIDVLILGVPDRDQLYSTLGDVEQRLGRPVQATIRDADWLESGTGSFHDTVTSRPILRLALA